MPVPSKTEFLRELDGLNHDQRMLRAALLGRDEVGTPELDTLLNELGAGDLFEQAMGLFVATAARDAARVEPALRHASRSMRGLAVRAVKQVDVGDEVLANIVLEGAPEQRRALARLVRSRGRTDLAESVVDRLLEQRGDQEAAGVLPGCRSATVARLLPEIHHAVRHWGALARRHPDVVLDHLGTALAGATRRERPVLWSQVASGLPVLAELRPGALLDLVATFGPPDQFPWPLAAHVGQMMAREPERVVDLLVRRSYRPTLVRRGLPPAVLRRLCDLDPSLVAALAGALAESPPHLAKFLKALPPSIRAEVFEQAYDGVEIGTRYWPTLLLGVLPHRRRETEVRRILALRQVQNSPTRTLHLTAFLPITSARPTLEEAARRATGLDRAEGYALLVSCTGRSNDATELSTTLTFLQRIINDQDPVRSAALGAFARVPMAMVNDDHIDLLRPLVVAVAEARDTSGSTRMALSQLAARLLGAHATTPGDACFRFALDALERLAGQNSVLPFALVAPHLPHGTETSVFEVLRDRLGSEEDRAGYDMVIKFTQALGRRAWKLADLQALVGEAARAAPKAEARSAIRLWLADPSPRAERVEQLLASDPTTIAVADVLAFVNRRRQDLLDTVLAGAPLKGRFLSPKIVFVPTVTTGFHRWLPRQQLAYARLQRRVSDDEGQTSSVRALAIRILARIPTGGFEEASSYVGSTDTVLAEAALGGLVWTDEPQRALPVLMDNLGSARARVAMYGIPRCARHIPPRDLGAALANILSGERVKVTVQKEAIRLLGRFRPPNALALLEEQWDRPDLHRDVRIAVGSAARNLLDHETAWRVLAGLAEGVAEEAFSLLEAQPRATAARHRARYGRVLLGLTSHSDDRVRRASYAAVVAWSVGSTELAGELVDVAVGTVADMGSGGDWRTARDALVAVARDGEGVEAIVQLVGVLGAAAGDESDEAGSERDLPARQRLEGLVGGLVGLPLDERTALGRPLAAMADLVSSDPMLVLVEARLRVAALAWDDAGTASDVLRQLAERCVGLPATAGWVAGVVQRFLSADTGSWEPVHALALAGVLSPAQPQPQPQPPATVAHLALAVVKAGGVRAKWETPWRHHLSRLRRHPDADVAGAARRVWTAAE